MPPATMSNRVELLIKDVKSCRGIPSTPMDTSHSPFYAHVRTLPVCSVGITSEAEIKSYGLAARAPLAITHPLDQVTKVCLVEEQRLSGQGTSRLNSPSSIPKNCPIEWAE